MNNTTTFLLIGFLSMLGYMGFAALNVLNVSWQNFIIAHHLESAVILLAFFLLANTMVFIGMAVISFKINKHSPVKK